MFCDGFNPIALSILLSRPRLWGGILCRIVDSHLRFISERRGRRLPSARVSRPAEAAPLEPLIGIPDRPPPPLIHSILTSPRSPDGTFVPLPFTKQLCAMADPPAFLGPWPPTRHPTSSIITPHRLCNVFSSGTGSDDSVPTPAADRVPTTPTHTSISNLPSHRYPNRPVPSPGPGMWPRIPSENVARSVRSPRRDQCAAVPWVRLTAPPLQVP